MQSTMFVFLAFANKKNSAERADEFDLSAMSAIESAIEMNLAMKLLWIIGCAHVQSSRYCV